MRRKLKQIQKRVIEIERQRYRQRKELTSYEQLNNASERKCHRFRKNTHKKEGGKIGKKHKTKQN